MKIITWFLELPADFQVAIGLGLFVVFFFTGVFLSALLGVLCERSTSSTERAERNARLLYGVLERKP